MTKLPLAQVLNFGERHPTRQNHRSRKSHQRLAAPISIESSFRILFYLYLTIFLEFPVSMVSAVASSDNMQSSRCSKPANRVRIVGKIRGFTDQESESFTRERKPWITIRKPQENGPLAKVTVSLDTQSTR